jgi:hypothetical protein
VNPLQALEAVPGVGHTPSATLQALNEALAAAWAEPAPPHHAAAPVADAPLALPNVGDPQTSSPGALAPLATTPSTLLHSAGGTRAAAWLPPPATPGAEPTGAPGTQATASLAWAPLAGPAGAQPHTARQDSASLPGHLRALHASGLPPAEPEPAHGDDEGRGTPEHPDLALATEADAPTPANPWAGATTGLDDSEAQAQAWCTRLQAAAQQAALDELARGRAVLLVGAGQAWCLRRQRVARFTSQASGPAPRAWQGWRLFRQGQAGTRGAWRARQPEGGCHLHLGHPLPTLHTLAGGRHWRVAEAHRLLHALGSQWSLLLLALPESCAGQGGPQPDGPTHGLD